MLFVIYLFNIQMFILVVGGGCGGGLKVEVGVGGGSEIFSSFKRRNLTIAFPVLRREI